MTANDRPRELDVEAMIRECVPGGTSCDPQAVADGIRAYFAMLVSATPIPIATLTEREAEHDYGDEMPETDCRNGDGHIYAAVSRAAAPEAFADAMNMVETFRATPIASEHPSPSERQQAWRKELLGLIEAYAEDRSREAWATAGKTFDKLRSLIDAAPSQPEARQGGLREALITARNALALAENDIRLVLGKVMGDPGLTTTRQECLSALNAVNAALARHPKGEDHA